MRSKATNSGKPKPTGNSACDYTFHMSVTKWEDKTEDQLARNRA